MTNSRASPVVLTFTILGAIAVPGPATLAEPVQWNGHPDEYTHYYELVLPEANDLVPWEEAQSRCEAEIHLGLTGYLATITSPDEQAFMEASVLTSGSNPGDVWLEGFQDVDSPNFSEPNGAWVWVTGEEWDYTNWLPGQPDASYAGENYLMIWRGTSFGYWNDQDWGPTGTHYGYIIEWAVPEPATLSVLGIGGLGLLRRRRK